MFFSKIAKFHYLHSSFFLQIHHVCVKTIWISSGSKLFAKVINEWSSKLYACWVIFSNICFFQNFQKNNCFHPFFLLLYNLNVKQFGSQMKPHILWGFIWVQIVCKGTCNQRMVFKIHHCQANSQTFYFENHKKITLLQH